MAPSLRSEKPGDEAAIRAVHAAAFPTPAEADLVDALRAAGAAAISEVALVDGAIVGHVLLSPLQDFPGVGLAPLAVVPGMQKRGIGAALVHRSLERARAAGASAVVLVGEPRYYARFGFRPARELGLRCKWPGTEEAFMLLPFDTLSTVGGLVSYHPAFDAF